MATNENAKWNKMISDFINYYQFTLKIPIDFKKN